MFKAEVSVLMTFYLTCPKFLLGASLCACVYACIVRFICVMPADRPWFHFNNDCSSCFIPVMSQWHQDCVFVQIVLGQQVSLHHSYVCQQAMTKMHLVLRVVFLFNKWSGSFFSKRPQLEVSLLSWLSLSLCFICDLCCQVTLGGVDVKNYKVDKNWSLLHFC